MYTTYLLESGIRLVYEKVPFAKSASIGIWVKSGSMHETAEENGISHFIEHMLFKGTTSRSARDIAEQMDFVGGHINACTERDYTCYYTKTLEENIPVALDILSDMYYNPLFKEEDIELERGVILEEINMYEDSPEDVALDSTFEYMWKKSALGRKISGSAESVRNITKEMLVDYYKRRYTAKNTVISVAGCFDEDALISLCENFFSQKSDSTDCVLADSPPFFSGKWTERKDIEQAHISIAYPCFNSTDPRIYPTALLNNILGGSMSSRLFQSLRENHGLCYSIYSYTASFTCAGMLGIYAGMSPDNTEQAMQMIEKEIHTLCTKPVSDYELEKSRSQIKCSIIMSRESVSARMSENGKSLLLLGKVRTDDEILQNILSVTQKDILENANYIFNSGEKATFILSTKSDSF